MQQPIKKYYRVYYIDKSLERVYLARCDVEKGIYILSRNEEDAYIYDNSTKASFIKNACGSTYRDNGIKFEVEECMVNQPFS